jgi:hypothetical protein
MVIPVPDLHAVNFVFPEDSKVFTAAVSLLPETNETSGMKGNLEASPGIEPRYTDLQSAA